MFAFDPLQSYKEGLVFFSFFYHSVHVIITGAFKVRVKLILYSINPLHYEKQWWCFVFWKSSKGLTFLLFPFSFSRKCFFYFFPVKVCMRLFNLVWNICIISLPLFGEDNGLRIHFWAKVFLIWVLLVFQFFMLMTW